MGIKWEWVWEFPGNMGIGFPWVGTGSGWPASSGSPIPHPLNVSGAQGDDTVTEQNEDERS